jgi:hypothetical protein
MKNDEAKTETMSMFQDVPPDEFDKLLTLGQGLISNIKPGIDNVYTESEKLAIEIASTYNLLNEIPVNGTP